MARFILRRLITMVLTMVIVSIIVFAMVEIAPGNVARNILGAYATPEQELSMSKQLGLDRPVVIRYISWLFGSDWQATRQVGLPVHEIVISQGTVDKYQQWWAVEPDRSLVQWEVDNGQLIRLVRQSDNSVKKVSDETSWQIGRASCRERVFVHV
jgi:peptide/nickel transport system permease protein